MSTNSIEHENEESNVKASENNVTIPVDYAIKHPLHNGWVLWFYENDQKLSWDQRQQEVMSFYTVEDFWSLYNHIILASELNPGSDYSIFKKGIKPAWEDEGNRHGGLWRIVFDRKQRCSEVDRYWLDIILCLIGEAFEHTEEVCGAVISIRQRGDRIGVWTAHANNAIANKEIGKKMRERLNLPARTQLVYITHEDSEREKHNPKITYFC